MKVIDAYQPSSPGKRPVCEGTLSAYVIEGNETRERHHGKEDFYKRKRRSQLKIPNDQCDNFARYRVGDKWLCRKHAAYALLDAMAQPQVPK